MIDSTDPILAAEELTFGFEPATTFLGPVNLRIAGSEFAAILGPNGAGKSTLLRLLAGLLQPHGGVIRLAGSRLSAYRPGARARLLAYLPQHPQAPAWATVEEIVRLGRFPYRSLRLFESPSDLAVVHDVLQETGTIHLAGRTMGTLSGGEAQRVHLAAALAQQPRILLLDEPTASLDLYHQISLFGLLRDLAKSRGMAVLAVTHDLNLAGQFCESVTVLQRGRVVAQGCPATVLTAPTLRTVYAVEFRQVAEGSGAVPWLIPVRTAPQAESEAP